MVGLGGMEIMRINQDGGINHIQNSDGILNYCDLWSAYTHI